MGYMALADDLRRGYARGGYEGALREWLKGVKKQPEFPFKWVETYVYTELHTRIRLSHNCPNSLLIG